MRYRISDGPVAFLENVAGMTPKKCSRCGKGFECLADSNGCWCEGYTLQPDTLQHLRATYNDCLCPCCLASYQQGADNTGGNNAHNNI